MYQQYIPTCVTQKKIIIKYYPKRKHFGFCTKEKDSKAEYDVKIAENDWNDE